MWVFSHSNYTDRFLHIDTNVPLVSLVPDKAAQAAAEAAQTAAMQSELHHPVPQPPPQLQSQPISPAPPLPQQHRSGSASQPQNVTHSSPPSSTVSPEQAVELIQKLGLMKYLEHPEQFATYEGSNMQ